MVPEPLPYDLTREGVFNCLAEELTYRHTKEEFIRKAAVSCARQHEQVINIELSFEEEGERHTSSMAGG